MTRCRMSVDFYRGLDDLFQVVSKTYLEAP